MRKPQPHPITYPGFPFLQNEPKKKVLTVEIWFEISKKKKRENLPAILSCFSTEGPAVNPGFAVV